MAAPAAVLSILVAANTASATASLTKLQTQLKGTTATANTTAATMQKRLAPAAAMAGKVITGGLVYAMYKGAKAGIDFEKQMDSLGAVANASTKEMAKLEKQALSMGKKTAFSANEVAVAQTELAKGGLKVKDIIGGALPAALSLAAAGEMELGEAAATTVNSMKLFGIQAKKSKQVADMLATAANTTTADVDDFAMALRQGGAAAKLAGLDLNETVTILEALAEAGVKNSDAGTSMKAALLQLINPTEKQAALAEELGINFIKANGEMMNGAGIAKQLTTATADMEKAERAKTFAVLAGSDGVRTLNALYEAGSGKLRDFSKANEEHGTAQDLAKKKMDNTAGSIEKLTGTLETMAIEGWLAISPAVKDAVDSLDKFFGEFTKDVKKEGLGKAIENAAPKVIDAAFDLGVKALKAMAEGWMSISLESKLKLAAIFGGAKALDAAAAALGKRLGTKFGKGWIVGMLLALPAIGIEMGKWVREHVGDWGEIGAKIGDKIGEPMANGLIDAANWAIRAINKAMDEANIFAFAGVDAPNIGEIGHVDWGKSMDNDGIKKVTVSLGTLIEKVDEVGKATEKTEGKASRHLKEFGDTVDRTETRGSNSLNALVGSLDKGGDSTERLKERASHSLKQVGASFDQGGKDADRFGDGTARMGGRVTGIVNGMVNGVGKGLKVLGENVNSALTGLKVSDKVKFTIKSVTEGAGKVAKAQKGAIVPGTGSGDKVPLHLNGQLAAMVEPGELVSVANRNATAALMNVNKRVPRFQKGGSVAAMAADASKIDAMRLNYVWGGSHGSSPAPHSGPFDCSSAVSHILQHGGGYDIPTMVSGQLAQWGKPGKGPVTIYANPEHVLMSINDKFWGTSSSNPGGGPGWIPTPSASYLSGFAARVPDGALQLSTAIKRVMLGGPDGPLKSMGQGALDRVRSAANTYLRKKSSLGGGNSNLPAMGGGVLSRSEMRSLLSANNLPDIMGWVAGAETNWNPSLVNSIGATGLFQILVSAHPDLNSKYNLLDAAQNTAAAATLYRANGLSDWVASQNEGGLSFGNGGWGQMVGKPFQKGGIVRGLQKGGELRDYAARTWNAAKRFIPSDWPTPKVRGAKTPGHWGHWDAQKGLISIPGGMKKALLSPKDSRHDFAFANLLHEFAHSAQDFEIDRRTREGAADLWSRWVAPKVAKSMGVSYGGAGYGYPGLAKDVAKKYPASWWQGGDKNKNKTQFRQVGGVVQMLKGGGGIKLPGLGKSNKSPFGPSWSPGSITWGGAELKQAQDFKKGLDAALVGAAVLEEQIFIADTLAALATSEGGVELGSGERAKLIGLHEKLLANVKGTGYIAGLGKKVTQKGLNLGAKGDIKTGLTDLQSTFQDAITDAFGLTGSGGKVFDIGQQILALKTLPTPDPTEPTRDILSMAGLRELLQAARYGVFDSSLPKFHSGGVVPGPIGQERPIMALGGEQVLTRQQQAGMFVGYATIQIGGETIAENVRMEFDKRGREQRQAQQAGVR